MPFLAVSAESTEASRFEFQSDHVVGGISDSVLSDQLSELVEAGLIARTVNEGPP